MEFATLRHFFDWSFKDEPPEADLNYSIFNRNIQSIEKRKNSPIVFLFPKLTRINIKPLKHLQPVAVTGELREGLQILCARITNNIFR
jgi:hypothetical protein